METDKATFRRTRLNEAAEKAGGKAALGKLLGYKDGSLVGQMIRDERPISESTIEKIESLKGFGGWFAQPAGWPFSSELYAAIDALGETDLVFAENALRAYLRMAAIPTPDAGSLGGEDLQKGTGTHGPR